MCCVVVLLGIDQKDKQIYTGKVRERPTNLIYRKFLGYKGPVCLSMAVAEDIKVTITLFTDQLYFLPEFKNLLKHTLHFYTFPKHLLILCGFKLLAYMDSIASVEQKAQRAERMI